MDKKEIIIKDFKAKELSVLLKVKNYNLSAGLFHRCVYKKHQYVFSSIEEQLILCLRLHYIYETQSYPKNQISNLNWRKRFLNRLIKILLIKCNKPICIHSLRAINKKDLMSFYEYQK